MFPPQPQPQDQPALGPFSGQRYGDSFPAGGRTNTSTFSVGQNKIPLQKVIKISGKNQETHFFHFKGEKKYTHKSISISTITFELSTSLNRFRWGHGTLEVRGEIEVRSFQQKLRGVDTSGTREVGGGGGCGGIVGEGGTISFFKWAQKQL